jgi:hypothetical protein
MDGVVEIDSMGTMGQEGCLQQLSVWEKPPSSDLDGGIWFGVQEDCSSPSDGLCSQGIQTVSLVADIKQNELPIIGQIIDFATCSEKCWDLNISGESIGNNKAESGNIVVQIDRDSSQLEATFENVEVELGGVLKSLDGVIRGTLEIECNYCPVASCGSPDDTVLDTWPPTESDYCRELYNMI